MLHALVRLRPTPAVGLDACSQLTALHSTAWQMVDGVSVRGDTCWAGVILFF